LWDDPDDDHLFIPNTIFAAEELIEAIADAGLELALPSGIPMHQHNVTKSWSRLDWVFLSGHSLDLLLSCDTQTDSQGILMDHLLVLTELNLYLGPSTDKLFTNFREVDWMEFHAVLKIQLASLPPPEQILDQAQLDKSCENLMAAIQRNIQEQVPIMEITPKSKHW